MTSYMAVLTNGIKATTGSRSARRCRISSPSARRQLCLGGHSTRARAAGRAGVRARTAAPADERAGSGRGQRRRRAGIDHALVGHDDAVDDDRACRRSTRSSKPRRRRRRISRRPARRSAISASACRRSPTSTSARSIFRTTSRRRAPTIRSAPLNTHWEATPGAYIEPVRGLRARSDLDQHHVLQSVPGRDLDADRADGRDAAELAFGPREAVGRLAGRDLPARHHAQPHRCVRDRGHAGGARFRGRRDRSAAARHHRHDQSVLHRQHAVRALGAQGAHVRSSTSRTTRPARRVPTARSIRRARGSSISRASSPRATTCARASPISSSSRTRFRRCTTRPAPTSTARASRSSASRSAASSARCSCQIDPNVNDGAAQRAGRRHRAPARWLADVRSAHPRRSRGRRRRSRARRTTMRSWSPRRRPSIRAIRSISAASRDADKHLLHAGSRRRRRRAARPGHPEHGCRARRCRAPSR